MSGQAGSSKSRLTKSLPGVEYVGAIRHRRRKLGTRPRVDPARTTIMPPSRSGHMASDRRIGL